MRSNGETGNLIKMIGMKIEICYGFYKIDETDEFYLGKNIRKKNSNFNGILLKKISILIK